VTPSPDPGLRGAATHPPRIPSDRTTSGVLAQTADTPTGGTARHRPGSDDSTEMKDCAPAYTCCAAQGNQLLPSARQV